MATQIQHAPNLPSHPTVLTSATLPPTGPRLQRSSAVSSAIRRGDIKISAPIPIDNVVVVNHDRRDVPAVPVTKRHTDPAALGVASAAAARAGGSGVASPVRRRPIKHQASFSEGDLRHTAPPGGAREPPQSSMEAMPTPAPTTAAVPAPVGDRDEIESEGRETMPPLHHKISSVDIREQASAQRSETPATHSVTVTANPGKAASADLSQTTPPAVDRRSSEKRGLRGALRRLFRRKSRGPDADKRRSRGPEATKYAHHRSAPVVMKQAPTPAVSTPLSQPVEIGGPATPKHPPQHGRKLSTPLEEAISTPLRSHLPFPMNVNAPSSPPTAGTADPSAGDPVSAVSEESTHPPRRRATLPSVVFNSAEVAALASVWNSSNLTNGRVSGFSYMSQPDVPVPSRTDAVDDGEHPHSPFPMPSREIGVAVTSSGSVRVPSGVSSVKTHRRSRSVGALAETAKRQGWDETGRRRSEETRELRASTASLSQIAVPPMPIAEEGLGEPEREGPDEPLADHDASSESLETAQTTQTPPLVSEPGEEGGGDISPRFSSSPTPPATSPETVSHAAVASGNAMHGFNFGPLSDPTPLPTPSDSRTSSRMDAEADIEAPRSRFSDLTQTDEDPSQAENINDPDAQQPQRQSIVVDRAPTPPPPTAVASVDDAVEDRLSRLESQFAGLEDVLVKLADANKPRALPDTATSPASAPLPVRTDEPWRDSADRSSRGGDPTLPQTARSNPELLEPLRSPSARPDSGTLATTTTPATATPAAALEPPTRPGFMTRPTEEYTAYYADSSPGGTTDNSRHASSTADDLVKHKRTQAPTPEPGSGPAAPKRRGGPLASLFRRRRGQAHSQSPQPSPTPESGRGTPASSIAIPAGTGSGTGTPPPQQHHQQPAAAPSPMPSERSVPAVSPVGSTSRFREVLPEAGEGVSPLAGDADADARHTPHEEEMDEDEEPPVRRGAGAQRSARVVRVGSAGAVTGVSVPVEQAVTPPPAAADDTEPYHDISAVETTPKAYEKTAPRRAAADDDMEDVAVLKREGGGLDEEADDDSDVEPPTPTTAIATLAHHVAHERAARKKLEHEVRTLRGEVERLRGMVGAAVAVS